MQVRRRRRLWVVRVMFSSSPASRGSVMLRMRKEREDEAGIGRGWIGRVACLEWEPCPWVEDTQPRRQGLSGNSVRSSEIWSSNKFLNQFKKTWYRHPQASLKTSNRILAHHYSAARALPHPKIMTIPSPKSNASLQPRYLTLTSRLRHSSATHPLKMMKLFLSWLINNILNP